MTPSQRPTFAMLLDWAEGRLDQAANVEIETRIAESLDLQEASSWIHEFLRASQSMKLAHPPADLGARLRESFRERMTPWLPTGYDDAEFDYDTRAVTATGTRNARTTTFHLGFTTADLEILVEVTRTSDAEVDVHGSVRFSGPDEARSGQGFDVVFTEARHVRQHVVSDAEGDFWVASLPVGVNEVWVRDRASDRRARVPLDLQ